MRTAAILPVKHFALAKQRLRESVSEPLREDLARAMVCDVLDALHDTASIEQTIVVTNEQSVAVLADQQGAIVIGDTANDGQSAAVMLGIERALALGIERVLCVPGDCPALDPGELAQLLGVVENQPEVVIVPDRHGTGTNGLLLAPPDVISPSFGLGSYERHRRARGRSWPSRIERRIAAAGHRHGRGPHRPARAALRSRASEPLEPARCWAARRRRGQISPSASLSGLPEIRAGEDLAAL